MLFPPAYALYLAYCFLYRVKPILSNNAITLARRNRLTRRGASQTMPRKLQEFAKKGVAMRKLVCGVVVGALLAACSTAEAPVEDPTLALAPGAPGAVATWSNAEKVAIGTSYEAYDASGQFSSASTTAPISKVWFSLTKDRITEVMWGLIHEAQIREIRFLLVGPDGIVAPSATDLVLDGGARPRAPVPGLSLIYPEIGQAIQVSTFTDPDRDTLVREVDMLEPLPKD